MSSCFGECALLVIEFWKQLQSSWLEAHGTVSLVSPGTSQQRGYFGNEVNLEASDSTMLMSCTILRTFTQMYSLQNEKYN